MKKIFILSESFPSHQLYSLTNQMQRAAILIPSNIAEGAGRDSDIEFIRFLDIANGSATVVGMIADSAKALWGSIFAD